MAQRLLALYPYAEHLARPQPFAPTVHARFQAGQRLLLIMATGIAVRTLAPVLEDKYRDPAVLVLDEHGQFVVPLLSGHEGGANQWAAQLATLLQAQCVITSARRYTQPLWVAGMGCARGCPQTVLAELLEQTLARHGLQLQQLSALASIDVKQDEVGLLELAEQLALPLHCYSAQQLNQYSGRLTQHSAIVLREVGCPGVAEAAALAAAEQLSTGYAELIIPKHKNALATVAVARAYWE